MSRRISVRETLTATQSLGVGSHVSNVVKVAAVTDARVYIDASVVPGGATLDAFVQASHENVDGTFTDIEAFNQISVVKKDVAALREEKLSTYLRVRYVVAGGAITVKTVLEGKEGV